MTKRLSISLPQLPWPTLAPNYVRREATWTRIRAENTQRETWLALLYAARAQWEGQEFDGMAKVSITIMVRGAGNRMDVPNWAAHGAWKILVDCLTRPVKSTSPHQKFYGLGILVDDSPKYVSTFAVVVEPNGEPETQIVIEEERISEKEDIWPQ